MPTETFNAGSNLGQLSDVTIIHGDCIEAMSELAADSVDAIVTDPPYGLEFMGKEWDSPKRMVGQDNAPSGGGSNYFKRKGDEGYVPGNAAWYGHNDPRAFQKWCELWCAEALRVLKPGGHLLAFGGTRTWHRLAVAVEDAGFEIRDSIAWLYGSGFPKSLDVSKAIDKAAGAAREVPAGRHAAAVSSIAIAGANRECVTCGRQRGGQPGNCQCAKHSAPATPEAEQWQGWGTALKPAFEPVVVGRKPLAAGTVAGNVLAHGTGALNIDATRTQMADGEVNPSIARYRNSTQQHGNNGWEHVNRGANFDAAAEASASKGRWPANVVLDESQAAALDEQSGTSRSAAATVAKPMKRQDNEVYGKGLGSIGPENTYTDSGGASRFFFKADPDPDELEDLDIEARFFYCAKAPKKERPVVDGVAHPTVKPLAMMRWLIRLVTPPGGTVLDPFAGSGTTVEAALLEGFRVIGIERETDYLPMIQQRIVRTINGPAA